MKAITCEMLETSNYRTILKKQLEERCRRNPMYSLRSFARDIEISASRLSEVMNGRYGLSRKAAVEIAEKLGFNKSEIDYFGDLVDSEHARSKKIRTEARDRIGTVSTESQQLSIDTFKVVSDWYHYAILELTELTNFESSIKWIADQLELSEYVISGGIERLKNLKLLEEVNGVYKATEDFTTSSHDVPSEGLKNFHTQVLSKAIDAIRLQKVEQRDFSSIVLALDPKDIPEAKEEIKFFRRKLNKRFERSKNKTAVYCLSVQLFKLNKHYEENK